MFDQLHANTRTASTIGQFLFYLPAVADFLHDQRLVGAQARTAGAVALAETGPCSVVALELDAQVLDVHSNLLRSADTLASRFLPCLAIAARRFEAVCIAGQILLYILGRPGF